MTYCNKRVSFEFKAKFWKVELKELIKRDQKTIKKESKMPFFCESSLKPLFDFIGQIEVNFVLLIILNSII